VAHEYYYCAPAVQGANVLASYKRGKKKHTGQKKSRAFFLKHTVTPAQFDKLDTMNIRQLNSATFYADLVLCNKEGQLRSDFLDALGENKKSESWAPSSSLWPLLQAGDISWSSQ
jgi:hypothetical protein